MRRGSLLLAALLLTGCGTAIKYTPESKYVVMFDKTAQPLDPTGICGNHPCQAGDKPQGFRPYDEKEWKAHVAAMIGDIMEEAPTATNGKRQILIFIHGGLNNAVTTVDRAAELGCRIVNGSPGGQDDRYYPIFLNWASPLPSSYVDHLVHVSQGRYYDKSRAIFAPFKFIGDLGRAIARAPELCFSSAAEFLQADRPKEKQSDDALKTTEGASGMKHEIHVEKGDDCYTPAELWKDREIHFFTGLIDYLISSPIIDLGGTESWHIMERRTQLLFHPYSEMTQRDREEKQKEGRDLSYFLKELTKAMEQNGGLKSWSVTLVGHSMGAIVADQMIRQVGDLRTLDSTLCDPTAGTAACQFPIDNIIYMAAASSIDDYKAAVFPLLRSRPEAKMYHLMLNPEAERRDSYYRITPRGTLLVWIDRFLSNPASPQQFTAGRYENFGTPFVYDTPLDLKPQIYLKVFRGAPHLSKSEPQHHGGFADDFPFWTSSFRTPAVRHKGCQDPTASPSMTTK